jgi:hypothetical protein
MLRQATKFRLNGGPIPVLDPQDHFSSIVSGKGLRFKVKAEQSSAARPIKILSDELFSNPHEGIGNISFVLVAPASKIAILQLKFVFGIVER